MTSTPAPEPSPLPRLGRALRPHLTTIAAQVLDDIRKAAPGGDGTHDDNRDQFLAMAAQAASKNFVDLAERKPGQERQVDELFKRIGYAEAEQGRKWEYVEAALQVATRRSWQHLATFATTNDLTSHDLRALTDALFEYIDHLHDCLAQGYDLANRVGKPEEQTARARLFALFLADPAPRPGPENPLGIAEPRLAEMAEHAAWPLPEDVVVFAASYFGTPPTLPESKDFLTHLEPGFAYAIGPVAAQEALIASLLAADPGLRVAVSWAVPPTESGAALRWCQRALDLVQLGVIPGTALVRCADHATQLWLHAEPSMRQRLCQELLEPLLAETPNSRAILSETLLTWVESPDSAPAIAARLDVHPQTVRYRWKRINELFGESLRDPEFVVQVALVLKSSVPMWKAGNQSDFERFRDRRESLR